MNEHQETHALVAFGDIEGATHFVSAEEVFKRLFHNAMWLITRPSRAISPGTRILFYQNGLGFKGHAIADEISDNRSTPFGTDIFLSFSQQLRLKECYEFIKPVSASSLLNNLGFITNKKYWGHSFRSTPRSISKEDYTIIMNAAKRLESRHNA